MTQPKKTAKKKAPAKRKPAAIEDLNSIDTAAFKATWIGSEQRFNGVDVVLHSAPPCEQSLWSRIRNWWSGLFGPE